MAATLTATRNPVGIWGDTATVTGTTTIAWDTGSAQRGRVYIKIATPPNIPLDETLFAGNPTTGDRNGSKALPVKFGSIYTLVLRQVSNNAVLATLVVTVTDLLQEAAEQAAATAALFERMNPSQAIHSLRIQAGTDTVRVAFTTVQPTIPVIRVLRLDGTEVDASFALGAGMQTSHQAVLGQSSPLDQGTEFEVKILASGHTRLGKPHDVTASHRFTTGTRPTTIFFQEIDVWRDGDPGLKGDGEFNFTFGAGDADSRSNLGEPWPSYEGDINDDDPPKFFDGKIDMPMGPRNLWIQAIGTENDADIFSGAGYNLGQKPHFFGAGTDWVDTGDEYQTSVTAVFDLSDTVYGTTLPLELVTGNFGVAFTIRGLISIQTQPGKSPIIFDFKKTVSAENGMGKLMVGAGDTGSLPEPQPGTGHHRGTLVARGMDGATYRKIQNEDRKQRRDAGWALVAPAIEGPVTALAVESDRVVLFALDAEGAVHCAAVAGHRSEGRPEEARPAKWRKLGGRFTGAVKAVRLANSVELLACDQAGAVFHLTLPAEGGKPESDWRRIGESLGGEIAALPLGKDAMAVFALGRRGEVRHLIYRDGRWRKEGWQVIAGATGIQLGAASAGSDSIDTGIMGVVLAVIDADTKLHTLAWRDYPAKKPAPWVSHGDFQAWLVRSVKPKSGKKPKSGRIKPKPAAARRTRARSAA